MKKNKWYGEQVCENTYVAELDKFNGIFLEGYLKAIGTAFVKYDYNENVRFLINCTESEIMRLNDFIDELTEN